VAQGANTDILQNSKQWFYVSIVCELASCERWPDKYCWWSHTRESDMDDRQRQVVFSP
jgi:hypothetical protein